MVQIKVSLLLFLLVLKTGTKNSICCFAITVFTLQLLQFLHHNYWIFPHIRQKLFEQNLREFRWVTKYISDQNFCRTNYFSIC